MRTLLIQSYRQLFGVTEEHARDGVVMYRIIIYLVLAALLGLEIGYYLV